MKNGTLKMPYIMTAPKSKLQISNNQGDQLTWYDHGIYHEHACSSCVYVCGDHDHDGAHREYSEKKRIIFGTLKTKQSYVSLVGRCTVWPSIDDMILNRRVD